MYFEENRFFLHKMPTGSRAPRQGQETREQVQAGNALLLPRFPSNPRVFPLGRELQVGAMEKAGPSHQEGAQGSRRKSTPAWFLVHAGVPANLWRRRQELAGLSPGVAVPRVWAEVQSRTGSWPVSYRTSH